jgi:hypothetical protein
MLPSESTDRKRSKSSSDILDACSNPSDNINRVSEIIKAAIVDKDIKVVFPEPCIPKPVPFDDHIDYLKLILTSKVYEVAIESPLQYAPKLSQKIGATVYFKRFATP